MSRSLAVFAALRAYLSRIGSHVMSRKRTGMTTSAAASQNAESCTTPICALPASVSVCPACVPLPSAPARSSPTKGTPLALAAALVKTSRMLPPALTRPSPGALSWRTQSWAMVATQIQRATQATARRSAIS